MQPVSLAAGLKNVNMKDLLSGCFFCAVGASYGIIALRDLPMGQVFNMGPGFFPVILCGLLLVIGGVLIVRSLASASGVGFGQVPWRAMVMVSLSILIFALLLEPLGLLLSVFAVTLIASFAAPKGRLLHSIVAAAGIAIFCVAVFVLGAQLQAPIFGSVFGG